MCSSSELRIPVIRYTLTPNHNQLQIPGVSVLATGANKMLSYTLTASTLPSEDKHILSTIIFMNAW